MADIITFPWIRRGRAERRNIDLAEYPSVKRWHDEMAARPAVQRGLAVLADGRGQRPITEAERENYVRRDAIRCALVRAPGQPICPQGSRR